MLLTSLICLTLMARPTTVNFPSADGFTLVATWYAPPGKKGKKHPGVILLHDLGGSRKDFGRFGDQLARKGIGCIALDLRAHGESTKYERSRGPVRWARLDRHQQKALYSKLLRDINAASKFLASSGRIDMTRIAIVGLGDVAPIAIKAAALRSEVVGVVAVAPPLTINDLDVPADIKRLKRKFVILVSDTTSQHDVDRLEKYARLGRDQEGEVIAYSKKGHLAANKLFNSFATKIIKNMKSWLAPR